MQPNKIQKICIALIFGLCAFFAPNAVFAQAKTAFKPISAAEWQASSATAQEIKDKKMAYIIANYADIKRIVAEEKRGADIGITIQEMAEALALERAKNPNPNVSLVPNN